MPKARIRKDIEGLSRAELDTLVRAFAHIAKLEPSDPNSFFTIAGYHGLPGSMYCRHASVLFPTWHRAYLLRFEDALRSAPGCSNVTLPFWNEVSERSSTNGLPAIFTDKSYTFADNTSIPNPLYSYTLQEAILDLDDDGIERKDGQSKPLNYTTVRYPYSGQVGPNDQEKTREHNQRIENLPSGQPTKYLNDTIVRWLTLQTFRLEDGKKSHNGEVENYRQCLDAPNYTVFSNTSSASAWNSKNAEKRTVAPVVSLEKPHNAMHLAVGGFDVPDALTQNPYPNCHGDMGENETAAFDPIFYFHHCFIDYRFWEWQERHGQTEDLDIIAGYKGTIGDDGVPLNLDTPLDPFKIHDPDTGIERPMISRDVINTTRLGYDYPRPERVGPEPGPTSVDAPKVTVSPIDRSKIRGSFAISTWAKFKNGAPDRLIDTEAILSRWDVDGCA